MRIVKSPASRWLQAAAFAFIGGTQALTTPPTSSHPASPPSTTLFQLTSGSNTNFFFRDQITTAQILATNSSTAGDDVTRRLVVALPAGNNGALTYFLPATSTTTDGGVREGPIDVQVVEGSIKSTTADFGNAGVQADLRFNQDVTLGVTIVGAVRALRDYVEGSGTMHEIFNYTLLSHSPTQVRLHRKYINSTTLQGSGTIRAGSGAPQFKSVDLYLSVPPGSKARFGVTPASNAQAAPVINIVFPDSQKKKVVGIGGRASHDRDAIKPRSSEFSSDSIITPPLILATTDASPEPSSGGVPTQQQRGGNGEDQVIRIRVLTNETNLVGLDTADLFLNPQNASTPAVRSVLDALPQDVAEQVSFLTFRDKFTAGGWRFLTYFGRDSMIALRMLMPLMTQEAIETALGAVIERANSTGALCHEETIGDYASFININNGQPELGNTPFYDYKMIDTDLYLLPTMKHYFLELPQGKDRAAQFLAKTATLQNGSYASIVNRIASYNINRALPFFLAESPDHTQLLAFRPGQPVGNWRDSNQGTGYGTIPFDVNVALVPASLRAVQSLLDAGILSYDDLDIQGAPEGQVVDMGAIAAKWEALAPPMFEVTVSGADAESRLESFVEQVGLDPQLLSVGGQAPSMAANETQDVSFYALSLMADGTPVQVLNSDTGFNLMYGTNVSAEFLGRVANALVPFPRGLLTNVGMVVANPAYDTNRTNVEVLDRTAYHGTVIWSFQQALMAGGLARQLSFCNSSEAVVDSNPPPSPVPAWCGDAELTQQLQDAQASLWQSIRGAAEDIYSEVWSWSFDNSTNEFSVADLASLSPDGTESDAIQLWSYGFLGLIEP